MVRHPARRAAGCALALLLFTRADAADSLRINGELKGITIDDRGDLASSGTLIVGERRIVVPPHLLVELPGATLTLSELFARAPLRCRTEGLSGLLATDR